MTDVSFSDAFSRALRGAPCQVTGLAAGPQALPVADWTRPADAVDHQLLDLCTGPTVDVGCGPGRMAEGLLGRGQDVLGIDVVHEAVGQTRDRGVPALHRSVFDRLPGEGRWHTALLADGNVGIGGDPVALLRRVAEIVGPDGRVVVELAPPGTGLEVGWAQLECDDDVSRPFRWAVVGADAIEDLARQVGLEVGVLDVYAERWVAVLVRPVLGAGAAYARQDPAATDLP